MFADSQAQLVLIDNNRRSAQLEAERDLAHPRRHKRICNKCLRRIIPAHNIYFLAAQFFDYILYPAAANTDTRADRVNLVVERGDRHLRSVPRLARKGPNLDNLFADLRHFQFEQPSDKNRMCARKDDLDLIRTLFDVENQASDSLARSVRLAHYLFAPRHEALGPVVDVHDHAARLISNNGAADDFALSLHELRIDAVPLVGTYLLDHHLLCGLCRNPAKLSHIDFHVILECRDFPGAAVDSHSYIAFGIGKVLSCRRDHRLFEIYEYRFPVDILVTGDIIHYSEQFLTHCHFS